VATGRVYGGLALRGSARTRGMRRERRESGSWRQSLEPGEVRSRALERALRGEGSLCDGRCLGSIPGLCRSRAQVTVDLGDFQVASTSCERRDTGGGRDRDARGSAATRCDRSEKLPMRRSVKHVGSAEASRSDVNQAIPRSTGARAHEGDGNQRGAGTRTKT